MIPKPHLFPVVTTATDTWNTTAPAIRGESSVDIALQRDSEIKMLKRASEGMLLWLAQRLYELYTNKEYELLGCDSFGEYLDQPEVDIGRAWAYAHVDIYRTYVLDLGVPNERMVSAGATKLRLLLPVVNKTNVDEMLDTADALSVADLNRELEGRKVDALAGTDAERELAARGLRLRTYKTAYVDAERADGIVPTEVQMLCTEDAAMLVKCEYGRLWNGLRILRDCDFDYVAELVLLRPKSRSVGDTKVTHDLMLVASRDGINPIRPPLYSTVVDAAARTEAIIIEWLCEGPYLGAGISWDREDWARL